ncbi:MAG: HAD family hydrolase [Acidimicrobiales bacterium]
MIEAVLFDLHGVVTSSPWAALASVGAGSGRTEAEVLAVMLGDYAEDGDHPWHCLERGEISIIDYATAVAGLAAEAGIDLDFGALRGFNDSIHVNGAVVSYIEGLRRRRVRVALVTNNVKEMADGWRSLLPDGLFDVVVDSSSTGVRKPNPEIFRLALRELADLPPERAVFLDDVESNVQGAREAGLHGIVVGDIDTALAQLDAVMAARQG